MALDDDFYNKLKKKYKAGWDDEKDKIKIILVQIQNDIDGKYSIDSPINIGGAGIVIKVFDINLGTPRALKFARPVKGKELLLNNIIASEISHLISASHPNIVTIYYRGEVKANGESNPFYIMEYIKDALDALEFIETHKPAFNQLIDIMKQCVMGLSFLHSRGTIHGDIKLENILVSPEGIAKISDLGAARLLKAATDRTAITCTRDFAHPELRALLGQYTDPNRAKAEVERAVLKTIFDIYALGKNVFRILGKYDIADEDKLNSYQRSYLQLQGARMLDGLNADEERALGLPKNVFQEIKYKSAGDIIVDIKKVTGEYSIHEAIPELNHHFPRTIQISSSFATPFTQRLSKLLSLPFFRRLAGVNQLGLIVQIYPTATHSRLEHILGTFSNVARFCDSLWNDPASPLFRQIMNEHDIKLVLLAALCHDIGQYPLAHDLEEAEIKLFSHKDMGDKLLLEYSSTKANEESASMRDILEKEWGVKPEDIKQLLSIQPAKLNEPLKLRLLHTLIDGPIDADKIDYLIRDAVNLNIPYGAVIDVERLLKCLTVVYKQMSPTETYVSLGIYEKGKIPAEAVLFARYAMFGNVYWHHTSRSVKSMLHHAVWEALPKSDRKSKEYKELQRKFSDKVLQQASIKSTGSLFPTTNIAESPQLSMSDYVMLLWVHENTTEPGKKLIKMLCERRLFKRISVISESKNASLWDKLTDFRKNNGWQQMIYFQREVQEKLVKVIDEFDSVTRTSTVTAKERRDEICARSAAGELLFLVDIPTERKSADTDLYFKSETRIFGPLKSYSEETLHLEESILWVALSRNFQKSIGKIRVFCHPDVVETCTACLNRIDIERILEQACQLVEQTG